MSKKGKRRSMMDTLALRVRELLDELERLLRPERLQPVPIPALERNRRRK